jgi:hypothetical protein
MTTSIRLHRQKFPQAYTGPICWTLQNLTTSATVSGQSFVSHPHGPVNIDNITLHYPDEYQLTIVKGSCRTSDNALDENLSAPYIQSLKPNPFSSDFTIEFLTAREEAVTINVYDMYGKMVEHQNLSSSQPGINTFNLNGAAWETGVYFIEIVSADQRVVTKAVKVK